MLPCLFLRTPSVSLSISLFLSAAHWNAHGRTYVAISHLCHDFLDGFAAESSSQRSSLSRPSVSGWRFRWFASIWAWFGEVLFVCLFESGFRFCFANSGLRFRSSYRISLLLCAGLRNWFSFLRVRCCVVFFPPSCLFFSSEKFDRLLREFRSNITSGKKWIR
jgi:hypothetical protein